MYNNCLIKPDVVIALSFICCYLKVYRKLRTPVFVGIVRPSCVRTRWHIPTVYLLKTLKKGNSNWGQYLVELSHTTSKINWQLYSDKRWRWKGHCVPTSPKSTLIFKSFWPDFDGKNCGHSQPHILTNSIVILVDHKVCIDISFGFPLQVNCLSYPQLVSIISICQMQS